ncbi:hypothetical protein SAMN04487948_11378 [Halogranum amylolyticum]|uniref:Uncharacterized protein n=1 Tax=Halogranum amylolyticum TaxID=660520 RepID=A0A1H8UZN2_9EURY|nr:hypothetical protein [Halogranum amylolyticum]SEP08443.1 hypothetical protein SAMN04487948_11378 [Halogranum amylolyticum]
MDRTKLLGLSLGGGIVITLVTGLVPLRTLMGGTHYGVPIAWLIRRVLAPEYFPWRVNWLGLVVDVAVWTVVVLLLLLAYERLRDRSRGSHPI